ncbi:class I adenylate-forming enzyme family protein [Micromonospora sp. NBS 11-29]|uniref:class I adenylate-forming enzyme family protein n=1 Tax=Micromonospora sp. NBS 11-29 TaxID=1960879 RepID=UPI000B77466A|nr:fatty acid--CoA ligase family protein [Micromonospora sp. NBS 11-29]
MSTTDLHYVQRLLTHFDADPERVALVSGDVPYTAGELADATRRAASAMREHGMGRGDVVGIVTEPNNAATLILQWAANLVGAAAAHLRWVNPTRAGDELQVELRRFLGVDAGARMLAVDPASEQRVSALLPDATDGPILAVLGPGGPGTVDLTAGSADGVRPAADLTDDDLAVITQIRLAEGVRSGVCWTFGVRNRMLAAAPCLPTGAIARGGPTTILLITPIIHYDVFTAEDTLVSGGVVVLHPGFVAEAVLRAVAAHRINRLMLGGPHVYALAEHPDRPATDLSSLTEIVYSGSPVPPHREREAREAFGPLLHQIYGTTEAGLLTMLTPDERGDPAAAGTVGRPVDPTAVSIRDPRTGAARATGEVGEICAVPRWPSAGYWHEPELTAALVRDGWVRTGDVGHLDGGGYLHVTGRLADMMTIKGLIIHTEVVEKVLVQVPGVSVAAVCGIEDADRVERVYAAVVPEPGAVVDPDEVRRHVAETLSDHHVPSLIEIRAKLPKTGWGKPDRVQLRADARAALTRLVTRV